MTGMNDTQPNRDQARYWNEQAGPRWVAMERDLDAQLEPFGIAVMGRIGLFSDQRVLEVGCGAGATSVALAERVQPGQVVGIDISGPLVARARQRGEGIENLRFACCVATTAAWNPSCSCRTARRSSRSAPTTRSGAGDWTESARPRPRASRCARRRPRRRSWAAMAGRRRLSTGLPCLRRL